MLPSAWYFPSIWSASSVLSLESNQRGDSGIQKMNMS